MDGNEQKIQPKVPRRATAIPLRSLGETQLLTVKKAAALVERGSVLVGALPGGSLEDLRPLFLRAGRLHLLRVLAMEGGLPLEVRPLLEKIRAHDIGGAEFTVTEDRCWYIRPFYQNLLWENEAGSLRWESHAVRSAVEGVFLNYLKFAESGGVHGRVAPQNVAVDDKKLILVDAGGQLLMQGVSGDGLHLSDGVSVLQEADLAGLARVVVDYFTSEQLGELDAFLRELSEHTIGTGAILNKARERFVDTAALSRRPGIIVSQRPEVNAPSSRGKILPGGLEAVPAADMPRPQEEKSATPVQVPREETPVIPLTEETVVPPKKPAPPEPTPAVSAEKTKKDRVPTAEEVLAWAENTTSLSRDVVAQIRGAVKGGVPEDKDSNPFMDESLAELERRTLERSKPQAAPFQPIESGQEFLDRTRGAVRQEPPVANSNSSSNSNLLLLVLGVGLVFSFLYVVKGAEFFTTFFESPQKNIDYVAYWESNIPSKMREVAMRAVVDRDSQAEITIIQDVLGGNKRPNVRTELLQVAFSPLWEQNLSPSDRQFALLFGLPNLIPPGAIDTPALSDAHPGVILAALSNLPLEENVGPVADIPVRLMAPLPPPFRESFAILEALGVDSFAAVPARALARLTLGITVPEAMIAFLSAADSTVKTIGFVRIICGLLDAQPFLADVLAAVALELENEDLQAGFKWFATDPLELWKETPALDRAQIFAGLLSEVTLGLEQLSDLLRFPMPHVRQQAIQRLQNMSWAVDQQNTIQQLGLVQEKGGLNRTGVISLVLALSKPELEQDSLIALWFSTQPDPQAVFELLMTRDLKKEEDSFSLEAARYLKDKDFKWTTSQKKKLSYHREMLVRALVYTRLDLEDKEEHAILENMREVEPNSFLRKQLDLKLEEFKGTFQFRKPSPASDKKESETNVPTKGGFAGDLAG